MADRLAAPAEPSSFGKCRSGACVLKTNMYRRYFSSGYLVLRVVLAVALSCAVSFGLTRTTKRRTIPRTTRISSVRAAVGAPVVRGGPWTEPTFADSGAGDFIDGEDLEVRRAAVEALGPYNGSVIAVDAETGRIIDRFQGDIGAGWKTNASALVVERRTGVELVRPRRR